MDKLINYIQFREKKYGVIKGIASVNSMYYQIGYEDICIIWLNDEEIITILY